MEAYSYDEHHPYLSKLMNFDAISSSAAGGWIMLMQYGDFDIAHMQVPTLVGLGKIMVSVDSRIFEENEITYSILSNGVPYLHPDPPPAARYDLHATECVDTRPPLVCQP